LVVALTARVLPKVIPPVPVPERSPVMVEAPLKVATVLLFCTIPAPKTVTGTVAVFNETVPPESIVKVPVKVLVVAPFKFANVPVIWVVPVIVSAKAKLAVPAETHNFPGQVIPVVTHKVAAAVVFKVVPAFIEKVGATVLVQLPAKEIVFAPVVVNFANPVVPLKVTPADNVKFPVL
jgi:hypothetical protein